MTPKLQRCRKDMVAAESESIVLWLIPNAFDVTVDEARDAGFFCYEVKLSVNDGHKLSARASEHSMFASIETIRQQQPLYRQRRITLPQFVTASLFPLLKLTLVRPTSKSLSYCLAKQQTERLPQMEPFPAFEADPRYPYDNFPITMVGSNITRGVANVSHFSSALLDRHLRTDDRPAQSYPPSHHPRGY